MDAASLDTLLARLRELHQAGGVRVRTGEDTTDWYEVMLFQPASEVEVAALRLLLGKHLPADFVRFWQATDGANLFVNDSGMHGVGVASTELISELQAEEAEIYGEEALDGYAVFARVNGAGDFLVFEEKTGRVLDGIHAEQPAEWRPIAESFTAWLDRFIQENGRYYWIEALYDASHERGR